MFEVENEKAVKPTKQEKRASRSHHLAKGVIDGVGAAFDVAQAAAIWSPAVAVVRTVWAGLSGAGFGEALAKGAAVFGGLWGGLIAGGVSMLGMHFYAEKHRIRTFQSENALPGETTRQLNVAGSLVGFVLPLIVVGKCAAVSCDEVDGLMKSIQGDRGPQHTGMFQPETTFRGEKGQLAQAFRLGGEVLPDRRRTAPPACRQTPVAALVQRAG